MLPVKVVQTEFKSVWGFEAEPEGKKHLSFFSFKRFSLVFHLRPDRYRLIIQRVGKQRILTYSTEQNRQLGHF